MIAEIRSDGAEPAPISRRHDAAPDSRPGSFFILAFPSRRGHLIAEIRSDGAEPGRNSRRHDAAPDSRIGFVRAPTACLAVPGVCLLRGGRSAPPTPGAFAGLAAPAGSPSTHQWACPAHTRGSFRFTTKGTKGVPGLRPWTLPVQNVRPHWCCAAACTRATFCHKSRPICHFKPMGKSVFISPQALPGSHPQLSIRGAAGMPPRILEGLSSRDQYR